MTCAPFPLTRCLRVQRAEGEKQNHDGGSRIGVVDPGGGPGSKYRLPFRRSRLLVPRQKFGVRELTRGGLRRIEKRQFVLQAPSEDADSQPQKHEDSKASKQPTFAKMMHSHPIQLAVERKEPSPGSEGMRSGIRPQILRLHISTKGCSATCPFTAASGSGWSFRVSLRTVSQTFFGAYADCEQGKD